jgi:hypothetical protein
MPLTKEFKVLGFQQNADAAAQEHHVVLGFDSQVVVQPGSFLEVLQAEFNYSTSCLCRFLPFIQGIGTFLQVFFGRP